MNPGHAPQKLRHPDLLRPLLLLLGLFGALSSCGKQGFVVSTSTASLEAPGTYTIPPKVDILLVEDDTGSIKEVYKEISSQVPRFLTGIQASGWDYHFATIPLTTDRPLAQVLASKYDSNWGTQWQTPFPGAPMWGAGTVSTSFFRFPSEYTGFLSFADTANWPNGTEWGFENITYALDQRAPGTGFLREDAFLVILALGNGDDNSRINYCTRTGDGIAVPCETIGNPLCTDLAQAGAPGATCGSRQISFDYYKSLLQGAMPSPTQVKFFAAVSSTGSNNCLGSNAYAGSRYMAMAAALGGKSFDVCTQNVNGVLDSLTSSLRSTKLAMQTRYLFINQDPELTSLQVLKNPSGDTSQPITLKQDATNGWTYAGYISNVYAIDYPINLNLSSGYAIELHGSAKLVGEDTASVTFLPKGAQNAAK